MPLDPSFTGRAYPPTEPYEVGREQIREFARTIGATDPAYFDRAAAQALGHPDVIAPPTFPIVITWQSAAQVFADRELNLSFSRILHGDQRFAYTRPVRAGDRLVCTLVLDEVMSRGGHDFLTTRIDVTTDAGEPVVTAWTKLVCRGEE
jgi:acyl dehydratase